MTEKDTYATPELFNWRPTQFGSWIVWFDKKFGAVRVDREKARIVAWKAP